MKSKTYTQTKLKKLLPSRKKSSSKIDGGKVLIVAGGTGLYGAGILSALAATRSGAGYTYLMSDLSRFPWLKCPDFIVHPISKINKFLKVHHDVVIAVGPGLGINLKTKKIIHSLLKSKTKKVILDADALTILSQLKISSLPSSWILTPHEGELARLLSVSSQKIKSDREKYIQIAQKKFGCTVILKGAETLIINQDNLFNSTTGTLALAKAGSGDVLLGMLAAFYAQTNDPMSASILAASIHGLASKEWLKEKNDYLGMRPVDLIERIPKTMALLRKS